MLPALRTPLFRRALPEPFARMRWEMDRLFDQFFGANDEGASPPGAPWEAPVSIWEDDAHLYLEIEVPGVAKDDLEVKLENGHLHITAERNEPDAQRSYRYDERRYGRVERYLAIPDVAATDSIDAELDQGVLHVKLAKRAEFQPKRITVKAP